MAIDEIHAFKKVQYTFYLLYCFLDQKQNETFK